MAVIQDLFPKVSHSSVQKCYKNAISSFFYFEGLILKDILKSQIFLNGILKTDSIFRIILIRKLLVMEYKHTLNLKKVEYLIGLKENQLISNFNKIYYNSLADIL